MQRFHPFFALGTLGMILTAVLHIMLAWVLAIPSVHTAFYTLYPVFAAFLIIGTALRTKTGQ